MISKATLEKHGIASFIGTIQTVTPKERAVLVRAFMISGPRRPQVERTLTFYLTENALINRSGTPTTLREIKTGEDASLTVQRAPNGKLMALSLSVGKPRGYPVAQPVPGKPGWVYSPYAPKAGPVDVSALPRGSEARCPFTQKIFFTPF